MVGWSVALLRLAISIMFDFACSFVLTQNKLKAHETMLLVRSLLVTSFRVTLENKLNELLACRFELELKLKLAFEVQTVFLEA